MMAGAEVVEKRKEPVGIKGSALATPANGLAGTVDKGRRATAGAAIVSTAARVVTLAAGRLLACPRRGRGPIRGGTRGSDRWWPGVAPLRLQSDGYGCRRPDTSRSSLLQVAEILRRRRNRCVTKWQRASDDASNIALRRCLACLQRRNAVFKA